jgi:PAS domain-containing protein
VQDISERLLAENALKQSHRLLQTIIETLPLRVFWKDRACRYLGCNTLFARDAGAASPADIIGKEDFQLGWHDQAELYRADDLAVMASGTAKPAFEEPQTTPTGRTNWLRTSKTPLRDWRGTSSVSWACTRTSALNGGCARSCAAARNGYPWPCKARTTVCGT